MKLIRQLGLLLIIFFLGLFIGDYGNHQIPIYLAPIVILWIMAWDDRRNRMLKRKMKQQKTKNQSNYFYIYDQEYRKRPITRCIASLQSSSYTVFKQKIGEDFL